MTTGWLAEHAFNVFEQKESILSNIDAANEATTRLRAIDTMLFEVLRWDKALTETERFVRAEGYADYVFGDEPNFILVLEAKREGASFVLSDDVPADRPVPFNLLARESPAAADALRQAAGYAVQLGATYVAVCNGHQWILGLTFVAGKPMDSRSVLVFGGHEKIKENFRFFWQAFSPLALQVFGPTESLLESLFDPPPAKLSARITNYPEPADRNLLRNELSATIEPAWAKVTQSDKESEFLLRCYINPEGKADDFDLAQRLLQDHQRDEIGMLPDAASHPSSSVTTLLADDTLVAHKPVVVLGRVGHGKSIFLQYLRNVAAKSELSNYIQIDIDFLDRPDNADEVPNYVYAEIDQQLHDKFNIDIQSDRFARSVLNRQLERFRETSRAKLFGKDPDRWAIAETEYLEELQHDRHTYFAHAFRHLKRGQRKSLALFFDNLDRQKDDIQEAAFLRASAIARDWEGIVFICLRPGTFQRSRAIGVLDAVAPRMITVGAPVTAVMLRRRFIYATDLMKDAIRLTRLADNSEEGKIGTLEELEKALKFFEVWETSFSRNKELSELFASVSNGNARAILHHVQQVMRSGHLNTEKILNIVAQQGTYIIAKFEALRALLFGDHKQYDPNSSPFINLFDIEHSNPCEHFSRLLILDYFSRAAVGDRAYGFRHRGDVQASLQSVGFSPSHIAHGLRALYDHKCVEGRVFDAKFESAGDEFRLTNLGRYHVADLVRTFTYVDAVVVDTPVLDDEVRRTISHTEDLGGRLLRARNFLRYLNMSAEDLLDKKARRLWTEVHDGIEGDITRAERDATE